MLHFGLSDVVNSFIRWMVHDGPPASITSKVLAGAMVTVDLEGVGAWYIQREVEELMTSEGIRRRKTQSDNLKISKARLCLKER